MRACMFARRAVVAVVVACIATLLVGASLALASVQTLTTSYTGYSVWTNKCSKSQPVYVAQPAGGGPYPVVIYLHGSGADRVSDTEGQAVVAAMASQGYLAASPVYESGLTLYYPGGQMGHAKCIFGTSPSSAVTAICALAEADCSRGLMVAGFSQGASIALLAQNVNPNVVAVWSIGMNGGFWSAQTPPPLGTRSLPSSDLIINDGQLDVTQSGTINTAGLQSSTGLGTCGTSFDCRQPDGSGYYIVSNAEVADHVADHCYWMQPHSINPWWSCAANPTFDPGFAPPSTLPWSLDSNLAFLTSRLH